MARLKSHRQEVTAPEDKADAEQQAAQTGTRFCAKCVIFASFQCDDLIFYMSAAIFNPTAPAITCSELFCQLLFIK